MTEEQRTILARCYVAMAEVDYDLARWRDSLAAGRRRKP